jgi:hypothetical protein
VSDLFKRHRPRLTEDEERALWERVREIPRAPGGARVPARRPGWGALWAMPAMRYGAPALAVALVAIVWVTQRDPVAPARQQAELRQRAGVPEAPAPAPLAVGPEDARPAPEVPGSAGSPGSPPVAESEGAPRDVAGARSGVAQGSSTTESGPRMAVRGGRATEVREEVAADVATETRPTAPSSRDFAPPPSAPTPTPEALSRARATADEDAAALGGAAAKSQGTTTAEPQRRTGFIRDDPRTGSIRRADEAPGSGEAAGAHVPDLRAARGSRIQAALLGDRILVEVLAPGRQGAFLETVTLPLSGGTARIAAGTREGTLWVEADRVRDLVRIAGSEGEAGAATRRRIDLTTGPGGGAAAIVAPDRRALTSHFVAEDGDERALVGPRSTPRSRAAALAAELILAVASGDARAVARVGDAAARLREERPGDEAARALYAWSQDARTAFESR